MSQRVHLLYMSLYSLRNWNAGTPQTNQAALARLCKTPQTRPDLILALCSESVCKQQAGAPKSTLEYFQKDFLPALPGPAIPFRAVPVADSMTEQQLAGAMEAVIKEIRQVAAQTGSVAAPLKLTIDFTGGMRDAAMLLMAVSRYLQDLLHIKIEQVLYTDFTNNMSVVKNADRLYRTFDLVSAVDEFVSVGRVDKLVQYLSYGNTEAQTQVAPLLAAITRFSDDLQLCRMGNMSTNLQRIQAELEKPSASLADPLDTLLYSTMRDRLKTEFGGMSANAQDMLPSLVKWCACHGLYQQAFTLLFEQMPEYICSHLRCVPSDTVKHHLLHPETKDGLPCAVPLPDTSLPNLLFRNYFVFTKFLDASYRHYPNSRGLWSSNVRIRPAASPDDDPVYRAPTIGEALRYLRLCRQKGLLAYDSAREKTLASLVADYSVARLARHSVNHGVDASEGHEPRLVFTNAGMQRLLLDICRSLQDIRDLSANC